MIFHFWNIFEWLTWRTFFRCSAMFDGGTGNVLDVTPIWWFNRPPSSLSGTFLKNQLMELYPLNKSENFDDFYFRWFEKGDIGKRRQLLWYSTILTMIHLSINVKQPKFVTKIFILSQISQNSRQCHRLIRSHSIRISLSQIVGYSDIGDIFMLVTLWELQVIDNVGYCLIYLTGHPKSVTKMPKLSVYHFASKVRHQHRCSQIHIIHRRNLLPMKFQRMT